MSADIRSSSALFKRAEQLKRWQESESDNHVEVKKTKSRAVNFTDGCIFLAACASGDKDEVLRLLAKGADVDTSNVDGLTALHAACIDDNLEMVEFLVKHGADVNRGDMEGWTPLHATSSCGFVSIARYLLDHGANLALVNNDGDLAIDIADSDDMENMLQEEVEARGIDCDACRNAEERQMRDDAQKWLQSGYCGDKPHPKTGATALHVAGAKGYIKVINLLLEAGADINAQDLDGWTPLHAAAHWGQRDGMEILVENGADMEIHNCVGQSSFDVADNTLLHLMKELKRKQSTQKVIARPQLPQKRKTSPKGERSPKKEREEAHLAEDNSSDEAASDVEKRNNKLNKENMDGVIVTLANSDSGGKVDNILYNSSCDEIALTNSEVQSWRRPSSLRLKTSTLGDEYSGHKDDASPTRDEEHRRPRRGHSNDHIDSLVGIRGQRLKAESCPALTQLGRAGREGGEGGEGAREGHSRATHSSYRAISSLSHLSERFSASDETLSTTPDSDPNSVTPPALPSSPPPSVITNHQGDTTIPTNLQLPKVMPSGGTGSPTLAPFHKPLGPSQSTPALSTNGLPVWVGGGTSSTNRPPPTTTNQDPRLMARSASLRERIQRNHVDSMGRINPLELPTAPLSIPPPSPTQTNSTSPPARSVGSSITTITSNGGTVPSPRPPPPRSMPNISPGRLDQSKLVTEPAVCFTASPTLQSAVVPPDTPSQQPPQAPARMSASNVIKNFFKSFVPPSRDEESETQRKAHAKMVRSTRRSTQGVTLEDIKSAEQLMKTKQQQPLSECRDEVFSSPVHPVVTPTVPVPPTDVGTKGPKGETHTRGVDEEERRPTWRLKVDDTDKNRFCLENVRAKEKDKMPTEPVQSATADITIVRAQELAPVPTDNDVIFQNDAAKPTNGDPTGDSNGDDSSLDASGNPARDGTQAAIQRRKKPKRRSTGRVQVNMDEIDPKKRAQRAAEQQGNADEDEDEDSSVSEKGEATTGNAKNTDTAVGHAVVSSQNQNASREKDRLDLDYKKMYEEQLTENIRLMDRLQNFEKELRQARETIETNTKKNNTRLAMADSDKREKRALERKLSEMEEELKLLDKLRQENQRIKDENGALIRVISKLSK